MFEQTFVPDVRSGRKPIGVAISLTTQGVFVALIALAPLFFSQPLPTAQLRSLLLRPVLPATVEKRVTQTTNSSAQPNIARVHIFRFTAPVIIPRKINTSPDLSEAAPEVTGVTGPETDRSSLLSGLSGSAGAIAPPPLLPQEKAKIKERTEPLAVGGNVAAANLIHKVEPTYPPLAKAARVQGEVVLQAVIGVDGRIRNLQLQAGHPLLVAAARAAILQWSYRPTLLNSRPVEVVTVITVRFQLSQ